MVNHVSGTCSSHADSAQVFKDHVNKIREDPSQLVRRAQHSLHSRYVWHMQGVAAGQHLHATEHNLPMHWVPTSPTMSTTAFIAGLASRNWFRQCTHQQRYSRLTRTWRSHYGITNSMAKIK